MTERRSTMLLLMVVFLFADIALTSLFATSLVFDSSIINPSSTIESLPSSPPPYNPGTSLTDIPFLTALRLLASALSLLISAYNRPDVSSLIPKMKHNGKKNLTKDKIEELEIEEEWLPFLSRYFTRPTLYVKGSNLITVIYICVKCMFRLLYGSDPFTSAWVWWCAVGSNGVCSLAEVCLVHGACECVVGLKWNRGNANGGTIEAGLPLLADYDGAGEEDVEAPSPSPAADNNALAESDIADKTDYKAGWSDLLKVCAPDMHLIFLAFVFLLMAATAQVYIPRFTGNVLDAVGASSDKNSSSEIDNDDNNPDNGNGNGDIWSVPGFTSNVRDLVIAAFALGIFSGLRGGIFTIVGGRVNARLRTQLMASLMAQDIGFFDVTRSGDISSRLCSDTTLVGDQVTLNVNVFLRSLVQAIGVLFFMFLISWELSLVAFVSVPAITVLSKVYGNFIRKLTKNTQRKLADANSVSAAALGSMRTVRAFGAEESEMHEYELHLAKYLKLNDRSARAYMAYAAAVSSLPQLVTALVLLYGGMLIQRGEVTGGQLVSFLLYLSSLSEAFGNMGAMFSSLTQAVGAADKVFELMHRKPRLKPQDSSFDENENEHEREQAPIKPSSPSTKSEMTQLRSPSDGLNPPTCTGLIRLTNVSLSYPARPKRRVLNGLDLLASPGSVVALVGPSGGGKSSVISLVQHLYEQTSGQVRIDGHDVHKLSTEWLSRHVSVVAQEPTLYGRSIKRNIMFGLEGTEFEPTFDQIVTASKMANAHAFISSLPDGYDTDVGERGVQMSGGQKQRIAIARALVRRPRVLLLDEATSALDAESEGLVQEAIDRMLGRGDGGGGGHKGLKAEGERERKKMTVIVVAHRLSTIKNADIICVVKEGKIVEAGGHGELLKARGAYFNLVDRQMNEKKKSMGGESVEDIFGEGGEESDGSGSGEVASAVLTESGSSSSSTSTTDSTSNSSSSSSGSSE